MTGPRRLGFRKIVASVYPALFVMVYRNWARHVGHDLAEIKALGGMTLLTWFPLLPMSSLVGGDWLMREHLWVYWVVIMSGAAGLWALHSHLLIRRRIGIRLLNRYDRIDPTDWLWIKLLTFTALALYIVFMLWLVGQAGPSGKLPEPVKVIRASALANLH